MHSHETSADDLLVRLGSADTLSSMSSDYESTAHELRDRIYALIPTQPQIMELTDCWGLFKVPGFNCNDLGPSMFQAQWALGAARGKWRKEHPDAS